MLEVLIIDDEPSAIKSLVYLIDWEQYGFEVAATEPHGEAALQRMRTQSFGLVITDIRMPVMDGLAFIEQAKRMSDVPVIIVSGYEDFDYARKAMLHGARGYLLKPVEAEDLVLKLEQIRSELESKALTEKRLHYGLPMMRDHYLKQWVSGYLDDREFLERLDLFPFDDDKHRYCLLMTEHKPGKDPKTIRFAVRNIVEETASGRGYVFQESDSRCGILLFGGTEEMSRECIGQFGETLIAAAAEYAKQRLTVAAGTVVSAFGEIAESYLGALRALDTATPDQAGTLISGEDMGWLQAGQNRAVIEEVKGMIHARYGSHINLRLLAEQVYMHPVYLGQLFKLQEGLSFNHYLIRVRMEEAKKLLRHTDKKIYEISLEVGYREPDWFYKKFKEYTGISASEYRKQGQ